MSFRLSDLLHGIAKFNLGLLRSPRLVGFVLFLPILFSDQSFHFKSPWFFVRFLIFIMPNLAHRAEQRVAKIDRAVATAKAEADRTLVKEERP